MEEEHEEFGLDVLQFICEVGHTESKFASNQFSLLLNAYRCVTVTIIKVQDLSLLIRILSVPSESVLNLSITLI